MSTVNYLGLRHMNHGLTLYLSLPLFRLVSGNLGRWVWALTLRVYKVFTKTGWGSLANRRLCLGPASIINCPSLSALSFCVSLFPGTCGYIWRMGQETPHFEESGPIWDYSKALWLESSGGEKAPGPSGRILLLNARTFHVSRW